MKNIYIIIGLLIANLSINNFAQAQECNANFTYSISTEDGLLVKCVPNNLSAALTVEWYLDGMFISSGTTLFRSFDMSGTYEMCLRVVSTEEDTCFRCITMCLDMATDGPPGTSSIGSMESAAEKLEVYPNPAKDQISITLLNEKLKNNTNLEIIITDIYGRTMITSDFTTHSGLNVIPMDILALSAGVYFINIYGDYRFESVKFVKQ